MNHFFDLKVYLHCDKYSSTFIANKGETIPNMMNEETTPIAAAAPKCITASIEEDKLDRNAILSLNIASANAIDTDGNPI